MSIKKYSSFLSEYPDVLSIDEMCSILKISTKTGYKLLKEGKISSLKIGRAYRVPKIHLITYLEYSNA